MYRKMSKPKKALIVSNTAFSIVNFRMGLMDMIRQKGFDVHTVCRPDESIEKLKSEGYPVIPIKNLSRKGRNPVQDIRLFMELFRIFYREKPDLVLTFRAKPVIYGSIAAALTGASTISVIAGLGYLFINNNFSSRIVKLLYRCGLYFSTRVVFYNRDDTDLFVSKRLVDPSKTVLIPGSGIDTDTFSPSFCTAKLKTGNNHCVFLIISRILVDKGIIEFVEAAQRVRQKYPHTEFHLLGPIDHGNPTGIHEQTLREWEKEKGVEYLGKTDDVRPYICASDVVVLPSYREGTPKSLLEGMAMAKAIITSDAPGCNHVVDNGINGYVVPIKNADALAEAMIRYIELSPEEKQEMGNKSREKAVKEFSEVRVVHAYADLIDKMVSVQ